jgi:dCMP deaminase
MNLINNNLIDRPNWNNTYMDVCEIISKRSTCSRLQTGSIIVKDNNIISIGYNGVPSNQPHCCDLWYHFYMFIITKNKSDSIININNLYKLYIKDNKEIKNKEIIINMYNDFIINMNFIDNKLLEFKSYFEFIKSNLFADLHHYWSLKNENHAEINAICKANNSLKGTTLYTYYSPCIQCAKVIASAGIKNIYYKNIYARDSNDAIKYLKNCNININQL